ncbi:polysaccharide deacetylase family protein [Leptothoe sp. ISB3NOV94-8A]|uniref:Polysaccharide deacetylase n=1 Tax=Adonisia turfae CCMR0081 TaxID=2292702 RepID=A0A6M0RMR6_9CYAN|nr:polysaccharide deacetylase family protein [Adonisia turfae]NEZ57053.1 polysaccharide deacetylase [Adonisia turfae CCMR0081]
MNSFLAISLVSGVLLGFLSRYTLNWLSTSYKFQLFGKMITCVDTTEKVLALTYDDGPNPPYTDNLLDVLKEFDAKATFFAIGQNIEKNIKTTRRMIDEGHELGNHSYSHQRLIDTSLATVRSEIQKTDDILSDLGVESRIHFRAPYGLKRVRLPWELARREKTNILWNVDPKDYETADPEKIAESIVCSVEPGSIILLHDGGGNRSQTVAATKIVLQRLQKEGYQFKTVSQLMALQAA